MRRSLSTISCENIYALCTRRPGRNRTAASTQVAQSLSPPIRSSPPIARPMKVRVPAEETHTSDSMTAQQNAIPAFTRLVFPKKAQTRYIMLHGLPCNTTCVLHILPRARTLHAMAGRSRSRRTCEPTSRCTRNVTKRAIWTTPWSAPMQRTQNDRANDVVVERSVETGCATLTAVARTSNRYDFYAELPLFARLTTHDVLCRKRP